MPTTIESTLRARVDEFVTDLAEVIRESALDAVRKALNGGAGPARRGPSRSRKKATNRKTARKGGRKATARTAGKRARRSPEDLEATSDRVLAHIKSNPGVGVEAIAKSLRKPTKELKRPVQMLVEAKKLRTEGQKRGTRYFAGAGGRTGKKRKTA
jgi:hypothetical protein